MNTLHDVAAKILDVPASELSDQSSPKNVKSWDSMKHIELMLAIETTFNTEFAPAEIVMINSLGSARALLQEKGIST